MGKTVLALGVAALALLAVLWWRGGERVAEPRASTSAEEHPSRPQPAELQPALAPIEETRSPLAESAKEVEAPELANAAPDQPKAARSIRLSGTLVVTDEKSVKHAHEDGTFLLQSWSGDRGTCQEVEVRSGSWSAEVDLDTGIGPLEELGATTIVLGERTALIEPNPARYPIPSDGLLALHARWPARSVLHVIDRATSRELAPVLLTEPSDWFTKSLDHPGMGSHDTVDLGPSPVEIAQLESGIRGTRALYARSPGYAWGRIELDDSIGGERFLALDPGGALDVRLDCEAPAPDMCLLVRRDSDRPVFELDSAAPGDFPITDLPVGEYRVTVELGDYWHEPLVLGEASAVVVAGARTSVALSVAAQAPVVRVPLGGTLLLPAEWGLDAFQLAFESVGQEPGKKEEFAIARQRMERQGGSPCAFRWKSPDVRPGSYEATLRPIGFRALLEVDESGLADARIEVPAPARLFVRCVDAAARADLPRAHVSWSYGATGFAPQDLGRDDALGCWVGPVPLGTVRISASCEGYQWKIEEVAVAPGANVFTLRLERSCGVKLIARDGSTQVPLGSMYVIETVPKLEPMEGQVGGTGWSGGSGVLTLNVEQPGLYRLKIPQIDGYEPVPDEILRLEKGVVLEHVVELVRKR